jgi:hypothetical protein
VIADSSLWPAKFYRRLAAWVAKLVKSFDRVKFSEVSTTSATLKTENQIEAAFTRNINGRNHFQPNPLSPAQSTSFFALLPNCPLPQTSLTEKPNCKILPKKTGNIGELRFACSLKIDCARDRLPHG